MTDRIQSQSMARIDVNAKKGAPITAPLTVLRYLGTVAFSLGLLGCSLVTPKFNRPNVSVVSIALRGGSVLQQDFTVKLNVDNPNDRALPVEALHVELHVAGETIASGSSDNAFVVPARGESEFDMTIKANLAAALIQFAGKIDQQSDSVDYELTGTASIDLPFMRELSFRQSGSFSLKELQ